MPRRFSDVRQRMPSSCCRVLTAALTVALCGCQQQAAPSGKSLVATTATQSTPHAHAATTVTFARDVAPIVFAKCAACHHPGDAAPFSLLTYNDVRRRARQIVEVTQKRFMPPWLPTEGQDVFVGARRLTDGELQTIASWVAEGTPRGEESEMPATPVFADGWQTGTPDLVIESPAYTLSSQDRDVFRNFVVPIRLEGPRWVQSIELRPQNPRVTHHARLGVDSSNESIRRDKEDNEPGYAGMAWGQDPDGQLVIWAPGMVAIPGTPGIAWRLFPNTCLVLHTHMQPSGKPEVVKFRIGIHFAKESPDLHPAMLRIGSCDIDIPAGAKHHVVTDQYTLPIDVDVQTIFPHAHSLCRELHVVAERPDDSREPLISIEHFDENWHDSYRYLHPVRLPKGTRLVSTFAYDNTDDNVRNRNRPPRRVVYGSNVSDEMADVYLQVSAVHADQREVLMEDLKRYEMQSQIVGYRKTLELYPYNPWSKEGLATCYIGLNKPGEAIAILEERIKTGPTDVYPVVSLGMARLANGDFVQAEAQHREALVMDDKYPLAWFGLGKALSAQKKVELAEQAYRRAIELAPGLIEAHLNLADLLIQRGQLTEASAVCSTTLGDSPDMANIYLKLAEISAKRRNYDESLEYCQKARRFAPYTHPAKVLLAVFCCANGEQERGLKLLHEARGESPNYPVPPLMLGQLASRQQQTNAARAYFAAAESLPLPDNWPASHKKRFLVLLHSERFHLAQQLQDVELARDALSQWLKCDPENRQLRTMYNELRTSL
jgi:Tfp pilus assembly protein PilF